MKDDLNRAESYQRLQARTIYRNETCISVTHDELTIIQDFIVQIQQEPPRSSKLTIGFGIAASTSICLTAANLLLPESDFLYYFMMFSLIIAIPLMVLFFNQFRNFQPEKCKKVEKLIVIIEQHKKDGVSLIDIPYNEPVKPPPMRIESG